MLGPFAQARAATGQIRIGLLRFGAVSWELDELHHQGLDRADGFAINLIEYAASPATQVALQSGDVDMIALDWLWVARQRMSGADWTFAPLSSAVGAVVVPADSPIKSVADLKGKRLGIAGTPIDKSWLILRAYGSTKLGFDPDTACDKSFAAPPLLGSQLAAGRIDAALTYWPYVAKAEVAGQRVIATVDDWLHALGSQGQLPMVGYVFSKKWADANAASVTAFLGAAAKARKMFSRFDADQRRLAAVTGTSDPREQAALQHLYSGGIVTSTTMDTAAVVSANRLYVALRATGGDALVGSAATLPPDTFWHAPGA